MLCPCYVAQGNLEKLPGAVEMSTVTEGAALGIDHEVKDKAAVRWCWDYYAVTMRPVTRFCVTWVGDSQVIIVPSLFLLIVLFSLCSLKSFTSVNLLIIYCSALTTGHTYTTSYQYCRGPVPDLVCVPAVTLTLKVTDNFKSTSLPRKPVLTSPN